MKHRLNEEYASMLSSSYKTAPYRKLLLSIIAQAVLDACSPEDEHIRNGQGYSRHEPCKNRLSARKWLLEDDGIFCVKPYLKVLKIDHKSFCANIGQIINNYDIDPDSFEKVKKILSSPLTN